MNLSPLSIFALQLNEIIAGKLVLEKNFFWYSINNLQLAGESVFEIPMYKARPAIPKTIIKTTKDATAKAMEHALPLEDDGFLSTPARFNIRIYYIVFIR